MDNYFQQKNYAKFDSWQYRLIKWLHKIKGGSALPSHLTYKLHNDWPWPLSKLPRELNCFSFRSSKWWAKWRMYPILLIGYNATRWMRFDDTVAYKSDCEGLKFIKSFPDCGVSPLQKLSKFSWHIAWPLHFSISWYFMKGHVFLFRIGARNDSLDLYYNIGPYVGFAWN